MEKKYIIEPKPAWAAQYSDKEILAFCAENEETKKIVKSGKGCCYLFEESVRTSNVRNDVYTLMAWSLSSPSLLQGAMIQEYSVNDNQHIAIHRVSAIRRGTIIDLTETINVRVLDEEQSSFRGSINKTKKVNCIIADLRLDDILVIEYSIVTVFMKEDHMDRRFFRWFRSMPTPYWYYKDYTFRLFNERTEPIIVLEKYFRNRADAIPEKKVVLAKGSEYLFERKQFQIEENNDYIAPRIEAATEATWEAIATFTSGLYEKHLHSHELTFSDLPKALTLDDAHDSLDRKIKKAIEYVQNHVTYLYDADVMHGHIPQSIKKTLAQHSGDCKAKALLLISILDLLGVKSEYILVNYDADYFIDRNLPSPFAFNHAIIKIEKDGKDYFIDPTHNEKSGLLENRAEPFFWNYLTIQPNGTLNTRKEKPLETLIIEREIEVDLRKKKESIQVTWTLRKELADNERGRIKNLSKAQLLLEDTKSIYRSLSLTEDRDATSIFLEPDFRVLHDDPDLNVLTVMYNAKLDNPYEKGDKEKVFKFYYLFDIDHIKQYTHKEVPCGSFCAYAQKNHLKIRSDLLVYRNDKITNRYTAIDNEYFSFSNKKKLGAKSVEVFSEFRPKTYKRIEFQDFEKIKKDFLKIADSNFGVGARFVSGLRYISLDWWWVVVITYVILQMSRLLHSI